MLKIFRTAERKLCSNLAKLFQSMVFDILTGKLVPIITVMQSGIFFGRYSVEFTDYALKAIESFDRMNHLFVNQKV